MQQYAAAMGRRAPPADRPSQPLLAPATNNHKIVNTPRDDEPALFRGELCDRKIESIDEVACSGISAPDGESLSIRAAVFDGQASAIITSGFK